MADHVLGSGIWLQIVIGFGNTDPARVVAEALAVSARGVLVHAVGSAGPALGWIARARADRAGLEVAVGIGSRGPTRWRNALADPAIAALRAGHRVALDWEESWCGPSGRANGARVAAAVLEAVPDAVGRVADNPWWAPLRDPRGTATHPRAPTSELGRLCTTRYVQVYPEPGADGLQPDGACARMLRWSRDPSQYPACGTPAARVLATARGYARSVADVAAFAVAEPHQVVYVGSNRAAANELTPQARAGLLAAARIRAHGSATVADYQRDAGLVPDGVVGPRTLAALGVSAP